MTYLAYFYMFDNFKIETIPSYAQVSNSRYIDGKLTTEVRYYISRLEITPLKLIDYTRNEWHVESMYW